jgi:hypothetical protein
VPIRPEAVVEQGKIAMSTGARSGIVLLAALAGLRPCYGQATSVPGGATPEQAVVLLARAAGAGDLDATCGLLVEEQSQTIKDWYRAQADIALAINAYADSLDTAFGKDPKSPVRKVTFDLKKELSEGFEGFRVVGKPEMVDASIAGVKVQMTVKGLDGQSTVIEQTLQARKGSAGWKLYFRDLAQLDFPKSIEFLNGLRKSIERTTKLVKEGKFKTREEAMSEVERDRPTATLPAAAPLPRFLIQ